MHPTQTTRTRPVGPKQEARNPFAPPADPAARLMGRCPNRAPGAARIFGAALLGGR